MDTLEWVVDNGMEVVVKVVDTLGWVEDNVKVVDNLEWAQDNGKVVGLK